MHVLIGDAGVSILRRAPGRGRLGPLRRLLAFALSFLIDLSLYGCAFADIVSKGTGNDVTLFEAADDFDFGTGSRGQ